MSQAAQIHKAGILDSGFLLLATAGGLFIESHTVPRKLFSASTLSRGSGIEQCQ
jgi:hypothetical protein